MKLRKLKKDGYDELFSEIDLSTFFNKDKNAILKKIDICSEDVLVDGRVVEIDIDIEPYYQIMSESTSKGEQSINIAKQLHQDFQFDGKPLPASIMYDKKVWTYLNLTVFFTLIQNKFIPEDEDEGTLIKKIQRQYFNDGGISKLDRTGLRYLWVLADVLKTTEGYDLVDIAWNFIDPFKAIQECTLGRNDLILKAFARAIQLIDYDTRIRTKSLKTIVPKHIRNHACSNFYDSYNDYNDLAKMIAEQIKITIDDFYTRDDEDSL